MKPYFIFARNDAHRFLPWHIGIMVWLATLLLLLTLSLGSWIGSHQNDYSGSVSVIIPGSLERLDEKTEQVKNLLGKDKAVASVKQVSESNLRELLTPWVGSGDALMDMPLPVVLDVTLAKGKTDIEPLKKNLSAIEPLIELDTHNSWADAFSSFIRVLQWLSILLVAVVLAAMVLMIMFSTRASLHLQERTVDILHGMGAEDGYIARQFQNDHFKLSLRAAAVGTLSALLAYLLLGRAVASIQTAILPTFPLTQIHLILIAIMPFACALVALAATRYSVLSQLRKVL